MSRPQRTLALLRAVERRLRRVRIAEGCCRVLAVLLVLAACSFLLDYALDLPRGVRVVLVALEALVLLEAVRRYLWAALRHRPSPEELALLVEERRPDLKQVLLTAVELTRPENLGARFSSPELLASVVEESEARVSSVPVASVVPGGRTARWIFLTAAGWSVAFLLAAGNPELLGVWVKRDLLLASVRWPKATMLELDPSTPGIVAMGDSLPVAVRVVRGHPRIVTIERRSARGDDHPRPMALREAASWDVEIVDSGGDPSGVLELFESRVPQSRLVRAPSGNLVAQGLSEGTAKELKALAEARGAVVNLRAYDVYAYEFRNVSEPFSYVVRGGDDEIGPFSVEVRLRPRIDMDSIRITLRYPKYTGRAAATPIEQRHGNIKAPAGTLVEFEMAANIPVRRVYFVLKEGEGAKDPGGESPEGGVWPDPGAVEVPLLDDRRFKGSFVVREDGFYYFQMEEENGFRSVRPQRFRIQALPDLKPIVRIVEPARLTEEVTPRAEVPIRVSIKDDYGIRSGALEGVYMPPESDQRLSQTIPLPGVSAADPLEAQAEHEVEMTLDIASLKTPDERPPAPGARFEFYAVAEDFGATGRTRDDGTPMGNLGESQVHLLQIVDEETLERLLTDQLMVVRDQLRELAARQQGVRKDLEGLQRDVLLAARITPADGQKLSRHRQEQHRLGEGLERQILEIERIVRRMEINRLSKEAWRAWVTGIGREIRSILEGRSRRAESILDELRERLRDGPQDPSPIAEAIELQKQAERELRLLVLRLSEFGDLSALIQMLREVRNREETLREKTRSLLERPGGSSR